MTAKNIPLLIGLASAACFTLTSHGTEIKMIDREVVFVDRAESDGNPRAMPVDADFLETSKLTPLPRQIEVPFEWKTENLYIRSSGALTDNVYREPGKPWLLQLGISTPGAGDTKAGSPQYKTWYRVSNDDGDSFTDLQQVVIAGETYSRLHPIEGVVVGRNGFNVDATRPIVRASNGEIMVPIGLHPWDEDKQQIYNPVDAHVYQDAGVLIGRWNEDGSDIEWNFGDWLRIDHNLSTRGLSEPTIVELQQAGHFAMVARGSNLRRPELPGYAWLAFSEDYCRSWSDPRPLTFSDGGSFYAPAAHSTLLRSRYNERIYWMGNLLSENPDGNHPRHPLVIAEVNEEPFGLIRESVVQLDDRDPNRERPQVQLSNFTVMENPQTGQLLISLIRRVGRNPAPARSWYLVQLPVAD